MTQWSNGPQPGPAGPYGRPGYVPGPQYGTKPPRETGAQVVCIVLLVLALIGAFIASAAVHAKLTNDSASAPAAPGSYSAGGGNGGAAVGGSGSSSTGGAGSIDFPVYPGAGKVASAKPYLKPYSVYFKNATNYVSHASVATIYRWYQAHLAAHHLKLYQPEVLRDSGHAIYQVNAPVNGPDAVVGDLTLEAGIHGYTIVMVQLYG